jgi:hypothetical protein
VKILAKFTLKKSSPLLKLLPSGQLETKGALEEPGPFQVLFIFQPRTMAEWQSDETHGPEGINIGGKKGTTQ